MQKTSLALILGLLSPLVFMESAEAFGGGKASEKAIPGGCLTAGLFLAAGQFLLVRKRDEAESEEETVIPMLAPPVAIFLLIAALEEGGTVLAQGVPFLAAGCLGTVAGAAVGRRAPAQTRTALARWLIALRVAAGLLLAVGATLAFAVRPAVGGFGVIALLHAVLAGFMLWKTRAAALPVISGTAGLIFGLLLLAVASDFTTHGTGMHAAAVGLYLCAGADLLVAGFGLAAATVGGTGAIPA